MAAASVNPTNYRGLPSDVGRGIHLLNRSSLKQHAPDGKGATIGIVARRGTQSVLHAGAPSYIVRASSYMPEERKEPQREEARGLHSVKVHLSEGAGAAGKGSIIFPAINNNRSPGVQPQLQTRSPVYGGAAHASKYSAAYASDSSSKPGTAPATSARKGGQKERRKNNESRDISRAPASLSQTGKNLRASSRF